MRFPSNVQVFCYDQGNRMPWVCTLIYGGWMTSMTGPTKQDAMRAAAHYMWRAILTRTDLWARLAVLEAETERLREAIHDI